MKPFHGSVNWAARKSRLPDRQISQKRSRCRPRVRMNIVTLDAHFPRGIAWRDLKREELYIRFDQDWLTEGNIKRFTLNEYPMTMTSTPCHTVPLWCLELSPEASTKSISYPSFKHKLDSTVEMRSGLAFRCIFFKENVGNINAVRWPKLPR